MKNLLHTHLPGGSFKNSILLSCLLWLSMQMGMAQSFQTNFAGVQIATGLDPVGIDVAPDGRIFLAEKNGKIRIIKNDVLLPTPFITIPNVDNWNERGLLKVLLDPNFTTNKYVYVYYTYKPANSTVSNNRVSRFTANGDVAVPGSELVLIDIDPLGSVGYHNGGGLAIRNDQLFISVGENTVTSNSQSLSTLKGKILRINTDGNIPGDNPFYTTATGVNRAIWALGFRNPFRISVQPGTGRLFINEVGAGTWEEINEGIAGKNYGWPAIEGARTTQTPPANYQDPFYAYNHSQGCSITAGAFYNPVTSTFPASYTGKYFFGDYCNGWLQTIDPATKAVATFATGINRPLEVAVANNGTLYFIARGGIPGGSDDANTSSNNGVLWKVNYTGNGIPVIGVQPASQTVSAGQSVTFTIVTSGNPAPTYQWQRNGVNITGATSTSYTIPATSLSDNGANFRVIVQNSAGTVTSSEATLTVLNNQLPVATIASPTSGKTYSGGDVITFTGTGTDAEDGTLPASAFTWKIDLHHVDPPVHTHPAMEATRGITSGSFTIPTEMETSPNVFFRIYLTVVDSKGATSTTYRDITPITSTITLASSPAGLLLRLDGSTVTAPYSFVGASRIQRELDAVSPQTVNGVTYVFSSWSDAGAKAHSISTPSANTILTATFVPATSGSIVAGGIYELEPQNALGQRLDVRGINTANGTVVELYQSNSGLNQRWKFIDRGNNIYELEPQHAPGTRLDVKGQSSADNAAVQIYASNGGLNQRWKLISKGNNIYELEPQCAIGKRLDIGLLNNETRAVSKTANSGASQSWKLTLIPVSAAVSTESLSNYPNAFESETTISFKKPVESKKALIQIYNPNGLLYQTLDVSTNTSGQVKFNGKEAKAGVYVYTLVVDGKVIASKRFVIAH
ncbi:PQQ-dependent sugar dehydrogenase [Cytophagaceae bacterium DM2B3-1]|uniref:PQQ-dependent sugar dehydrogenase n=1 Tax=Xanthocytophaga flava TaxID=3048013 RepID=A0ABT7CHA6_9BACT|nr:PQQ-dependent sugar dehydrogenase [Xanthocytophaga flavus]MDJ1472374.1 PQQ-dependent sugar dehydrogenase [Xanthocytophaga flavus]MDJ1493073.1 PQQ-dependent sugar dehydrogenase [Xanthocytophaga flavus]